MGTAITKELNLNGVLSHSRFAPAPGRDKIKYRAEGLEIPESVKGASWDFDGTTAFTEPLHRRGFHSAAVKAAGVMIPARAWQNDFKSAFGLPERGTCEEIARVLFARFPREMALRVAAIPPSAEPDPVQRMATFIQRERGKVVDYFMQQAELRIDFSAGYEERSLQLGACRNSDPEIRQTHDLLGDLRVATMPHVVELKKHLHQNGVVQCICSNSPRSFVEPLLKRLDLAKFHQAVVCAGDPDSRPLEHELEPNFGLSKTRLWRVAARKLSEAVGCPRQMEPQEIIVLENTAGPAVAAWLVGFMVVVTEKNRNACLGELLSQVREQRDYVSRNTDRLNDVVFVGKLKVG